MKNKSRKYTIKSFITIIFLMLTANLSAQVGGISGSKISSYTVDVVDHHKLEFEPAFYHIRSSKYWDENSDLKDFSKDADSVKWITGLNFRITYGLLNKLEVGLDFSSDLLLARLGARYIFFDKKHAGLALIAGINVPMGNKTVSRSIRLSNTIAKAGGGLVFTGYFNPNFSVDVNAQYFRFIENTIDEGKGNWYLNSDFGYFLFKRKLQLIAGFGYQLSRYKDFSTQAFTIYPGITIETGKQYIIVLSSLFDLWGENVDKNAGVALALTITLN